MTNKICILAFRLIEKNIHRARDNNPMMPNKFVSISALLLFKHKQRAKEEKYKLSVI